MKKNLLVIFFFTCINYFIFVGGLNFIIKQIIVSDGLLNDIKYNLYTFLFAILATFFNVVMFFIWREKK